MESPKSDSLFAAGKAKWLLQNIDKLSEDERGLLLAIANLEKDTGRQITPEEQAALDQVAKTCGFNPSEIAQAIDHMVTAKAKRPVEGWPDIQEWKKKRRQTGPLGQ
ncbi:MAG: hypothetical protein JW850_20000 [Thermoflexales bacterium]|nr:hypothetical protein [Thermoflexales bacterium]